MFIGWFSIEEFLRRYSSLDQIEGVYRISFDEPKDVDFYYTTDNEEDLVSKIKLQEHFKSTDKQMLLIANTKNLYRSIKEFYNENAGVSVTGFTPKSAKVIWQMVNPPELYISFWITGNSVGHKKAVIENYNKQFGCVPLGNKTFNNNDAIPSWSGFNYQGKGIILRAIELINELWETDMNEANVEALLKEYSIEIELKEDFVLYHKANPFEYIQVKATLEAETYSKYEKAVKQLKDHRSEGRQPEQSTCILMSAVAIRNWNEECGVYLYNYNDSFLGLLEIPRAIKEELAKLLTKMQQPIDDYKINIVYENLCGLLDQRVHEIHNSGRGYKLGLYKNFWCEVKISYTEHKKNALYEVYELMYTDSCTILEETITKRCDMCKRVHTEYNCDTCPLASMKENFLLTDLIDYVRILKPNTVLDGTVNQIRALSQVFSEEQLESLFFQFQFANLSNYRRMPTYHMIDMGEDNQIIPTLLSFRDELEHDAISTTLSKIRQNIYIKKDIDGKALTVDKPHFPSKNILEENITNYKQIEARILAEDGLNVCREEATVQDVNVTLVDKMSLIMDLRRKSDKYV